MKEGVDVGVFRGWGILRAWGILGFLKGSMKGKVCEVAQWVDRVKCELVVWVLEKNRSLDVV